MNQNRSFLFESMVREDDSEVKKIEMATDPGKPVNFQFNIDDTSRFRDLFSVLDHFVMMKGASVEFEKIDYKDYYVNQIIKEVTKDTTHFDQQSDSVKDVLKQSLHRRNQIYKQIKRSLDHFNDTKHLIDKQLLVRENYWKTYLNPLLTLTDTNLYFEFLSENQSIYCYLRLNYQFNSEENTEGSSWMEYSKKFSNDMRSLYPLSDQSNISNTKPRSDIRVIRRSDTHGKRLFSIPDSYFTQWIINRLFLALLPYQQSDSYPYTIDFTRATAYSIIARVLNSVPEDEELDITFKPGTGTLRIQYLPDNKHLIVSLPHESALKPISFRLSSSLFYAIAGSIQHIKHVTITKINDILPVLIQISMEPHDVIITYQPKLDALGEAWQHLYLYHSLQFDTQLSSPFMEYVNGDKFFDISIFTSYEASLGFSQKWFVLSDREHEALRLVSVYERLFKYEGDTLSFSNETITAKLKPYFELDCNCTTDHSKTICTYYLSLLYFDLTQNMRYTDINANRDHLGGVN